MYLNKIINLKVGEEFLYKGNQAKVIDRSYSPKEETKSMFDSPAYFIMVFDGVIGRVVLSTMYPDPKSLNLVDYELKK